MQIEVIIEKKSHKLDAEEGKTILETLQEHGSHVAAGEDAESVP